MQNLMKSRGQNVINIVNNVKSHLRAFPIHKQNRFKDNFAKMNCMETKPHISLKSFTEKQFNEGYYTFARICFTCTYLFDQLKVNSYYVASHAFCRSLARVPESFADSKDTHPRQPFSWIT